MFGIAIVPSILLALGMAICPESPRWLYQVVLQPYSVICQGKYSYMSCQVNQLLQNKQRKIYPLKSLLSYIKYYS